MDLKETVSMITSLDYKERFKAEYIQLQIRMSGLKRLLVNWENGSLTFTPKCSYDLLNGQLKAMSLYAEYLEERAIIEGIDLEGVM